ncbi:MAG: hypothetical protein ACLTBR_00295 [Anaerostipes sp.]|uniref:hypothetical protein n=1 Tax=Anaerostipes sp. TaxID=1872530 RepID=UPI00399194EE
MKRIYESPKAYVEMFTPNEYVAACGDSGKVYNFECDAKGGPLYYYSESDGNIDGVYNGTKKAELLGYFYTPCSEKHEANNTDGFYDGFVDYNWNKKPDQNERVIVWRGEDGRNGHATTKLNMSEWETAKS